MQGAALVGACNLIKSTRGDSVVSDRITKKMEEKPVLVLFVYPWLNFERGPTPDFIFVF